MAANQSIRLAAFYFLLSYKLLVPIFMFYKHNLKVRNKILFSIIIAILSVACTKKIENISLLKTSDIYPLTVGKVFIYRMDSIILNSSETGFDTLSYLAMDSVESQFHDATGNLSYRIFRYISDTALLSGWSYASTIITTFNPTSVTTTENNLKFVTLTLPISDGSTWLGNEFINTTTPDANGNTPYQFLDGWQYIYENSNQPYTGLKGVFDSTYTVLQQNQLLPNLPIGTVPYQTNNYSIEVYAKNTGLIYKYFLHWTWQTNSYTDNALSNDGLSYGFRMNLIATR